MALELNGTTGVSLVQDGVITDANLPAGSVLQVVSATILGEVQTTSSTYSDTGLSASITPSSASNKIMVILYHNGCGKSSSQTRVQLSLQRDGSDIIPELEAIGAYTATTSTNVVGTIGCWYLDSPATTSSVTYKTQFASYNNSGAVLVGWNSASTIAGAITLMEVAG